MSFDLQIALLIYVVSLIVFFGRLVMAYLGGEFRGETYGHMMLSIVLGFVPLFNTLAAFTILWCLFEDFANRRFK